MRVDIFLRQQCLPSGLPALIFVVPPYLPLLVLEGARAMLWKHLSFAVTTLCHGSHFGKTEALQDTALIPRPHGRTSVLSSCLPCAPTPQDLYTHGFHARNVILGIATHGASAGASSPLSSSLILSKTALSLRLPSPALPCLMFLYHA